MSDLARRLSAFLSSRARTPCVWGANDCALFTADWVKALRGVDHGAAFRGRYDSAFGAARAIRRAGHDGLIGLFRAAFGKPLASPRLANRGDIAVFEGPLGETAGVVVTGARIATPGPDGIAFAPLSKAMLCWRA